MQGIRKLTSNCFLNEVFGHYHFVHVFTSKVEPIWMLNSSIEPLFARRHVRGRLYGCSTHLDISTLQFYLKTSETIYHHYHHHQLFNYLERKEKKHKQDEAESLSKFREKFPKKLI